MNNIGVTNWGEYRIGALFRIQPTAAYKMNNPDLFKVSGSVPVLSNSSVNNGIAGYCGLAPTESGKIITFSDTTTGADTMFYQEHPFIGYPHVQGMYPLHAALREMMNSKIAHFLITVIRKAVGTAWTYGRKFRRDIVENVVIRLPQDIDGNPDWNYMQELIAELEQELIAELEQYLVAAGLNDYELNDEDNAALISSKNMADFNLAVLFNISKGKRLTKKDQTKGNTPFIGSCDSNNGVTGYIGQPPLFEENAITISYNGSVGQVFYQEKPFWASDDINVLYLRNHTLNRDLFGYLGAALYKVGKQFSYTYKWNLARMEKSAIKLPIQTNEEGTPIIDPECKYHAEGYIPDWDYMTAYIRAMKKVVIADVVKYKDEVIAKTRSLVSAK